jgi:outer membrane protein TolC
VALGLAAGLSACAVKTDPLTLEENVESAQADLSEMFAEQETVEGPIDLYEAMARAIRYNLDSRLRAMEQALQQEQVDVAAFELLPQIDGQTGIESRSNTEASSSENVDTGQESLAPSTSTDTTRFTGDVRAVWNVLDFGVSFVSARQASDRAKIAFERRRKVVHDIIQDVRTAYWRAVAAERLLERIDPLMQRVERALADSARIEELALQSPMDALTYQRGLLDSMRQLQQLRRDLTLAKTELAALMNLPPDADFAVEVPDDAGFERIEVALEPEDIELLALTYRPELREERYAGRISQAETRKALLRMLPGIEFDTALNFDSNSFLVNNTWASYGARITWNLFNLISGPSRMDAAEAEVEVAEARRMAVSMAVLVQAHVAYINYRNAREDFGTAAQLREVDARMLEQLEAQGAAAASGDLPVIRGELNLLLSDLRRDLAYAELNNASGAILLSIGADPLPASVPDERLDTLAAAIRETEEAWRRGEFTVDAAQVSLTPADGTPADDMPVATDAPAPAAVPRDGDVEDEQAPLDLISDLRGVPDGESARAADAAEDPAASEAAASESDGETPPPSGDTGATSERTEVGIAPVLIGG